MTTRPTVIIMTTRPTVIYFSGGNCDHRAPTIQKENFGGNQLLDGSFGLSPLLPVSTSDLHVRGTSDFHQNFLWLHLTERGSPSFRSLTTCYNEVGRLVFNAESCYVCVCVCVINRERERVCVCVCVRVCVRVCVCVCV